MVSTLLCLLCLLHVCNEGPPLLEVSCLSCTCFSRVPLLCFFLFICCLCCLWTIIFHLQHVAPASSFLGPFAPTSFLFSHWSDPPVVLPWLFLAVVNNGWTSYGRFLCSLFTFHCSTIVHCPILRSLCLLLPLHLRCSSPRRTKWEGKMTSEGIEEEEREGLLAGGVRVKGNEYARMRLMHCGRWETR